MVVDNTSPEARQRQLEAQVQVAFAKAAGRVLTFLAGKADGDMVKAMQEFITVHEAAEAESIDLKGIAIRVPKLDRSGNDENEHINAILRGSLNMVAALLKMHAKVPIKNAGGKTWTKAEKRDYDKALEEIGRGIERQLEQIEASRPARRSPRR
jgi:UDP-N-acetylglucosamine enolpyruvyl transferase